MTSMLRRPSVLISYSMTATIMMGSFMIIPNISAYMQFNLGFPRSNLGQLYLFGGLTSFALLRAAGYLTDRLGPLPVATLGTVILVMVVFMGFAVYPSMIPPPAIFVGFMGTMSLRNVPYSVITSQVPGAHERARFMSLQSAVQNISSAMGAGLSSLLLLHDDKSAIIGMPRVTYIAIAIMASLPVAMLLLKNQLADQSAR